MKFIYLNLIFMNNYPQLPSRTFQQWEMVLDNQLKKCSVLYVHTKKAHGKFLIQVNLKNKIVLWIKEN